MRVWLGSSSNGVKDFAEGYLPVKLAERIPDLERACTRKTALHQHIEGDAGHGRVRFKVSGLSTAQVQADLIEFQATSRS